MARQSRWRFDPMESSLIALLLAVVIVAVVIRKEREAVPSEEVRLLADAYGPDRNSQYYEEWIIRDFIGGKRGGFFVDVGANHYRRFSNTYYLETQLDWEGLAVEPLTNFGADYATYRPRTRFRSFFVSDQSDAFTTMYTLEEEPEVSSGVRDFTQHWGEDTTALTVPTITLNDLLDHEGIETFDFLNMDIELWEPMALAGFDIGRFRPDLVCIEAHPEVRQQILDYFHENGYVVVGKYLRADVSNLYFMPASGSR